MTYFKIYYRQSASHTHVRVFSAKDDPNRTYGKNGDLIFRNEEWADFQLVVGRNATVEWIKEDVNYGQA
jgi:hypothetical protein